MKFIPAKKTWYSEIAQQKHITFSFCNKTIEEGEVTLKQMFDWVQCRDFLSDVLFAEENKEVVSKYEFTYDPEKQQIDRDKMRLLITFEHPNDVENFLKNIPILHGIEESNGIPLSKFTFVKKNIFLVEGSKMWQNTTFSLSLYTYLIKILGYEILDGEHWFLKIKQQATNEGQYANQFIPQFEQILYLYLKKLFARPITVDGFEDKFSYVSYIHDNGGVVSLFKNGAYFFSSIKNNDYYQRLTKIIKEL